MTFPTVEGLLSHFSKLKSWEDKYGYLLRLGQSIPPMDQTLKTPQTEVKGCITKVWMVIRSTDNGALHILADSNSSLTKGLVAILICIYDGKTPTEVSSINIKNIFEKIGLEEHLAPNRRSGFFSMVSRLQELGMQSCTSKQAIAINS